MERKKGYKLIAHTPNLIFIKNDEVGKIYGDFSYKSSKLFNYHHFLKWRNIKRSEVLKLFFNGFSELSLINNNKAPSTKNKNKNN